MIKYLPFLIVLACSSVSAEQKQFLVVIDNSFDQYKIQKIQDALLYWEKKSHIDLKIEVKDVSAEKYSWRYDEITTIYNASDGWQRKTYEAYKQPRTILGITVFPAKDIFLVDSVKIFKTTMHEFGHILGLDHVDNKWDVMYCKILGGMVGISWAALKIVRETHKEYLFQ
jgi:predicted Zn-dependent protease